MYVKITDIIKNLFTLYILPQSLIIDYFISFTQRLEETSGIFHRLYHLVSTEGPGKVSHSFYFIYNATLISIDGQNNSV